MRIKLDEHLGNVRIVTWLSQAGHDVSTVHEQKLTSAPDTQLIEVCRSEQRCLITCDRGFGNRLRYNPTDYPGIVILRFPPRSTFEDRQRVIKTLILGFEQAEVSGKLWIVEGEVINEYQPIGSEAQEDE
jgi:predicted nuclease of predicted toxin-antitoxin system